MTRTTCSTAPVIPVTVPEQTAGPRRPKLAAVHRVARHVMIPAPQRFLPGHRPADVPRRPSVPRARSAPHRPSTGSGRPYRTGQRQDPAHHRK